MKTLVEIYDEEMILNIITSYNLRPDKTIFLYVEEQQHLINNEIIHKILGNDIEYLLFDEHTLIDKLNELDDVCFDIHGGNNLAITIVSQIARERNVPLYYPDLNKNVLYHLLGNELKGEYLKKPKLSVRDIVYLYGASVRNLPEVLFDEEGRKVVEKLMAHKRKNNKRWASFTKTMSFLNKRDESGNNWSIDDNTYKYLQELLDDLKGIIEVGPKEKGKVRLELIDKKYLLLLTDTGVAFEYDTYYQMLDSGEFDDVDIRVNIDWNGEPFNHEDPNSELDVMATKDGRLISVSCKSGKYDQQAIYEVKANAVKFGGQSCVAVLATDFDKRHPELVKKAEEIGVFLAEYKTMWDKTFVQDLLKWMKKNGYIM